MRKLFKNRFPRTRGPTTNVPSLDDLNRAKIYRPLDREAKEIRILAVEPGDDFQPVHCSIRHISLTNPSSEFETISYTWQDASIRSTVYVDGHILDVPASAERVLRKVRHPDDRTRLLWLDAVSINQADVEERSQQVATMHEIFASGTQNLIWLGESDDSTARALESIEAIVDEMKRETNNYVDLQQTLYFDDVTNKVSDVPLFVDADINAVDELLCSAWFTRLWIVQEAAFALQNVCHKGEFVFPLDDVLKAASWLIFKSLFVPYNDFAVYVRASLLHDFVDRRHGKIQLARTHNRAVSAARILSVLGDLAASDSRDYVYGAHGLLQTFCDVDLEAAGLIPDYTLPLHEVLRRATLLVLSHSTNLLSEALNSGSDEHRDMQLPTWVRPLHHKRNPDEDPAPLNIRCFNVTRNEPCRLIYPTESLPNVLGVSGILTDKVQIVFPRMQIMTIWDFDMSSLLQDMEDSLEASSAVPERISILPITLAGGSDFERQQASPERLRDGYAAYRAILKSTEVGADALEDALHISSAPTAGSGRLAAEFHYAMLQASANRRVFTTTKGRLGLGPRAIRDGDNVAVVFGCRAPVILRQANDGSAEYRFVGQAYLHGIMHGEAFDEHRAAGKEDEWFMLR